MSFLNFRKYKAKSRLCDWLESCNLVMEKKFFQKYKGMDEKRYTGEDKEFFERARKKNPKINVFYSPDLYIYHRERRFFGFLLQRSCFGMDFLNLIKYNVGLRGFQPILPLSVFLIILAIFFSNIVFSTKVLILITSLFFINFIIFLEIKKYISSFKDLFFTNYCLS